MCAVFELLSMSLHKLFSQQPGKPNMAIIDIQKIAFNILETLALLKDMQIIHTDLKPDNILLKRFFCLGKYSKMNRNIDTKSFFVD